VATRDEEEVTTAIASTQVARAGDTGSPRRAPGTRLTNIFHVSLFCEILTALEKDVLNFMTGEFSNNFSNKYQQVLIFNPSG